MMSLGGYTFEANPYDMPIIGSHYRSSWTRTFGGAARIGWGKFTAGQLESLKWDLMSPTQYDALHALWVAGDQVIFNPDVAGGTQYNVHIEDLVGTYWQSQGDESGIYRQNVQLDLLIMSVV